MSSKKGIHVSDLLDSYVKGTLEKSSSEKVKTHIIFCNVCRDQLKRLESNPPPKTTPKNEVSFTYHKEKISQDSPEPLPKGMDWHFPLKSAAVVAGIVALYSMFRSRPESKITPNQIEAKHVEMAPAQEILAPTLAETPKINPTPIPIQTEDFKELAGDQSGIVELTEQLVSNYEDWKVLWNQHVKSLPEKPSIPAVDFDRNDVAAIFAGSKPSSGYSVKITGIDATTWNGAPARVFIYKIESPAAGTASAAVLTSPFIIMVVPNFNGPTFFRINP